MSEYTDQLYKTAQKHVSEIMQIVGDLRHVADTEKIENDHFRKNLAAMEKENKRLNELLFAYDQTRTPPNPVHVRLLENNKLLKEVVDTLPKTVDEITIVIGMRLWTIMSGKIPLDKPREITVTAILREGVIEGNEPKSSDDSGIITFNNYCYSTREAAKAAKEEGAR